MVNRQRMPTADRCAPTLARRALWPRAGPAQPAGRCRERLHYQDQEGRRGRLGQVGDRPFPPPADAPATRRRPGSAAALTTAQNSRRAHVRVGEAWMSKKRGAGHPPMPATNSARGRAKLLAARWRPAMKPGILRKGPLSPGATFGPYVNWSSVSRADALRRLITRTAVLAPMKGLDVLVVPAWSAPERTPPQTVAPPTAAPAPLPQQGTPPSADSFRGKS
jgi:hypothetical protein